MPDETIWIRCPECGNVQSDMGVGSECEECGATMPTTAPGAVGTEQEATDEDIVKDGEA